jgi:hypothetical protein
MTFISRVARGVQSGVPACDAADLPFLKKLRALFGIARRRNLGLRDKILFEHAGRRDLDELRRDVAAIPDRVRLALGTIDDLAGARRPFPIADPHAKRALQDDDHLILVLMHVRPEQLARQDGLPHDAIMPADHVRGNLERRRHRTGLERHACGGFQHGMLPSNRSLSNQLSPAGRFPAEGDRA